MKAHTFFRWPSTSKGNLRLVILALLLLFAIYRIGWQIPSPIFS